jgi:hypothetical protein
MEKDKPDKRVLGKLRMDARSKKSIQKDNEI